MYHYRAEFVQETNMHKAFRTVLVTSEGETDVYGFSESDLNPAKCLKIHTTSGNFNIENDEELGVYKDQEPIDWNLPSQN